MVSPNFFFSSLCVCDRRTKNGAETIHLPNALLVLPVFDEVVRNQACAFSTYHDRWKDMLQLNMCFGKREKTERQRGKHAQTKTCYDTLPVITIRPQGHIPDKKSKIDDIFFLSRAKKSRPKTKPRSRAKQIAVARSWPIGQGHLLRPTRTVDPRNHAESFSSGYLNPLLSQIWVERKTHPDKSTILGVCRSSDRQNGSYDWGSLPAQSALRSVVKGEIGCLRSTDLGGEELRLELVSGMCGLSFAGDNCGRVGWVPGGRSCMSRTAGLGAKRGSGAGRRQDAHLTRNRALPPCARTVGDRKNI